MQCTIDLLGDRNTCYGFIGINWNTLTTRSASFDLTGFK